MNKDTINNACPSTASCKLGNILADLKDKKTVTALTDIQVEELNNMCPGASICKFGTLVNDVIAGKTVDTKELTNFKCPAGIAEALQEIIDANDDDDNSDNNGDDSNN